MLLRFQDWDLRQMNRCERGSKPVVREEFQCDQPRKSDRMITEAPGFLPGAILLP